MIRFGIVLYDGFDELDAIGPWEVLRSAAKFGAPFETRLVQRRLSEASEALDRFAALRSSVAQTGHNMRSSLRADSSTLTERRPAGSSSSSR